MELLREIAADGFPTDYLVARVHGTRAGLLNVAGTQAGLAVCIAIVAIGLASLVQAIGWWFDWLRIVGAAYLIWIGWKLIRSTGEIDMSKAA